jgi:hypothetical protein
VPGAFPGKGGQMKPRDYIFILILTCAVVTSLMSARNSRINESIHKTQINGLKVKIEALENKAMEQARYKATTDEYKTKVDDMTMSYYTLDQILKNMGLEAQRRYTR